MAYADQDGMSTNRLVSVIIVILLHAFLGYALVTGLAYDAVTVIKEKMTVVDVKEEEPPEEEEEEEPPPEPEKQIEPPVVSPPPLVQTLTPPPTIRTVSVAPPSAPIVPTAAPPAPPPPAAPAGPTAEAKPRGNPSNWANTNDYPSRALQQEREGTTSFRVTIGLDGRVVDCVVTQSSGHDDLDAATCSNVKRRARFEPAVRNGEKIQGSYANRVRWQIPK